MSNIIDVHQLYQQLPNPNLVIADCRFALQDKCYGQNAYQEGHLPRALFFDLEKDLSGQVAAHGGRHPLPKLEDFIAKLEQAGIKNESLVVVYDDDTGMFAGRLWWMLRYVGHQSVKVLSGGFEAWQQARYPITQDSILPAPSSYHAELQAHLQASLEEVKAAIGSEDIAIVDARAPERYRGEIEPIDAKAGHIPSAINKPFQSNLEGKHFKNMSALKDSYQELLTKREVIAYCGSGVSATHNILAMNEAGLDNVRLYVGSWSDWSSYKDNPVALGH